MSARTSTEQRVAAALLLAKSHGGADGEHHKMWCIDQMVRALTGCPMVACYATDARGEQYCYQGHGASDEYVRWVESYADPEPYGLAEWEWDAGVAP